MIQTKKCKFILLCARIALPGSAANEKRINVSHHRRHWFAFIIIIVFSETMNTEKWAKMMRSAEKDAAINYLCVSKWTTATVSDAYKDIDVLQSEWAHRLVQYCENRRKNRSRACLFRQVVFSSKSDTRNRRFQPNSVSANHNFPLWTNKVNLIYFDKNSQTRTYFKCTWFVSNLIIICRIWIILFVIFLWMPSPVRLFFFRSLTKI